MLKQSLHDSWFFFKNHVISLSIIILPIVIPVGIISMLYQELIASAEFSWSDQIITMLISVVAYPIVSIAVIFYIVSAISGEIVNTKTLWQLGIKFWLPYFILTAIITIAIIFGLVLLLVPGIILAVRYSFSEFDLLLNKSSPLDAMKSSWNLTKEYMWVLLGGVTVITIALYGPFYLVSALFDESGTVFKAFTSAINMILAVFDTIYTIFIFRIYELAKSQRSQLP
jgi:hypothetical protein